MTANGLSVLLAGSENVLKVGGGDGCTTLNILKTIELYSFSGRIL